VRREAGADAAQLLPEGGAERTSRISKKMHLALLASRERNKEIDV